VDLHPLQTLIAEKYPNVAKMDRQLTRAEAEKIKADFEGREELVVDVLGAMDNYKQLTKKNNSVNLTLRNWIKRRDDSRPTRKPEWQKGDPIEKHPEWNPTFKILDGTGGAH